MKYDLFFKLAKEAGIEEAELTVSNAYSFSASVFRGEISSYEVGDSLSISARGIINGKFGAASCDSFNKEKAQFLVDEIVKNAKIIENTDPAIIFKGSPKYKKVNMFNKELGDIPAETKIAKLFEIEKRIKEADPRIVEVEGVDYSEQSNSYTIMNSHGLNLVQKVNYYVYDGAALAKEADQQKTGFDVFFSNDYSKFSMDELVNNVVTKTISQLGGEAPKSGKYKAVLCPRVVSSLINVLLNHVDSEEVQKKSSFFAGKLGQQVVSKKITIEEKPLAKTLFARWFDDEGVATYNKPIIKNGVLETFLYNLTTAAKEGRESTGNGYKAGSKMGISTTNIVLKPGKKSLDELFAEVGNGVYITHLSGLHAGMNSQSGNFSLQAEGFLIKDGKKDRALDLITVSGNLFDLFNDVKAIGSDSESLPGGTTTPSIYFKKLMVGGK